jgi:Ni/Co efflux regulator RcnB
MMKSRTLGVLATLGMVGSTLASVPAMAQSRYDYSRGGYSGQYYNRDGYDSRYDRDRNGYDDRYDRNRDGYDDRYDRNRNGYDDRYERQNQRQWRYYGGNYGYNGYNGRWRTGQRYPYYNQGGYILNDYGRYGLPAPRRGYRYYRDNNGDVVMAAIATGVIGLIIGGALSDNHRYDRRYRRGY